MRISKFTGLAAIVISSLILSGCFTAFALVDNDFKPKGKTIAVVPGINDDMNLAIAALMTESLQKQSRYQVMSQQQIAKALGNYPQNVKGPYKSAYFEINVDWTRTDTQKLAALQRALKVDYLYVLWAPNAVNYNNNKVSHINVVTQMYEFPAGKEIGQGHFPLRVSDKDESYLKEDTAGIALAVAEKTGMALQK
jgi:hypothetical protein